MASFDIIDATGKGYVKVWNEKAYLYQLVSVPIIIKFICFLVIKGLGWEENFLRQALVMLPSYFADGWMLSHFVRLIFLNQRWPFKPSGNPEKDIAQLQERARGIMGGTLLFALTEFVLTGLFQIGERFGRDLWDTPVEQATSQLIGALAGLYVIFWAFRFLWFYIPAALGYPLSKFLTDIRGFSVSFSMIGTWLVAFIPVLFLFQFLLSLVLSPYGGAFENLPIMLSMLSGFLIVLMDTIVSILVTACMAYGLQDMYLSVNKQKKNK